MSLKSTRRHSFAALVSAIVDRVRCACRHYSFAHRQRLRRSNGTPDRRTVFQSAAPRPCAASPSAILARTIITVIRSAENFLPSSMLNTAFPIFGELQGADLHRRGQSLAELGRHWPERYALRDWCGSALQAAGRSDSSRLRCQSRSARVRRFRRVPLQFRFCVLTENPRIARMTPIKLLSNVRKILERYRVLRVTHGHFMCVFLWRCECRFLGSAGCQPAAFGCWPNALDSATIQSDEACSQQAAANYRPAACAPQTCELAAIGDRA